jgi:hypothetical protein
LVTEAETLYKGYYIKYVPPPNVFGTYIDRLAILIVDSATPDASTLAVLLIDINVVPGPDSSLANTIVAGNTAAYYPDAAGVFTDLGGNLIGTAGNDVGNTGFTVSTLLGTLNSPLDPMLMTLGNYGGLTQTMLPELGSPVIGAGNILNAAGTLDQRDFPRTLDGHVDIGADEFQGASLTAAGGTPQSAMINKQFPSPLTANLSENLSHVPLSGQTVGFTAPVSGASAALVPSSAKTDSNGNASTTATANATDGSYSLTASFGGATAQFALTNVTFAGTPGQRNCVGKTVSALAHQYGWLGAAASALGYPSVKALLKGICGYC